jgi:hypothetical protein
MGSGVVVCAGVCMRGCVGVAARTGGGGLGVDDVGACGGDGAQQVARAVAAIDQGCFLTVLSGFVHIDESLTLVSHAGGETTVDRVVDVD